MILKDEGHLSVILTACTQCHDYPSSPQVCIWFSPGVASLLPGWQWVHDLDFQMDAGICSANEEEEFIYTLVDVYEFSWAQEDSVTCPRSQNLLFSDWPGAACRSCGSWTRIWDVCPILCHHPHTCACPQLIFHSPLFHSISICWS